MNIEADELSRGLNLNEDLEWALDMDIFQEIVCRFGKPDIDLFASRIKHKLEKYISFRSAPNAWQWMLFQGRSITSSPLIDNSKLVAPTGLSDFGFSHKTSSNTQTMYQPNNPERTHTLQKLKLGAFCVSGKFCKAEELRESLPTSSFKHGDNLQRNNMRAT